MRKNSQNTVQGAIAGAAVGATVLAAGLALVHTYPAETRKLMKKAEKSGKELLHSMEETMPFTW